MPKPRTISIKAASIPIFVVIASMIIGLANPATGVINIEGKNFWLIKSLPTDYNKYLWVKLCFAWILTVPGVLVASTIAVVFRHGNVWDIVFAYVIPLLFALLGSLIGLIVALHHPKLKWNNEAEAVKNSASVLIALLINIGAAIVLGAIVIPLAIIFPAYIYAVYLGVAALILIPLIFCAIYLRKNFAKRIKAIEEL